MAEAYADALGLPEPVIPWHTLRGRIGELASALAVTSGAVAKVARDVILLSQTEVAEVREGHAAAGSSAMPHKRNPVAAICALACAQQAPGLAATLLGAMAHEHERAAGAWHAEWRPLGELLRSTGSAVAWILRVARGAGGRPRADAREPRGDRRAAAGRAGEGRGRRGRSASAPSSPRTSPPPLAGLVGAERAAELLDPTGYLGSAGALVDRALDFYDREG